MLRESEFILTEKKRVYHLDLEPGEVARKIITVGDPDRVDEVSKHFSSIEIQRQKREFKTITGEYQGERITVLSTGIGTDNIDIVLNEVDALFNIDFATRKIRDNLISATILRLGTSGAIHEEVKIDSLLASAHALGSDGLMFFYHDEKKYDLAAPLETYLEGRFDLPQRLYSTSASAGLIQRLPDDFQRGITLTNPGFYGPQGRSLRIKSRLEGFFEQLNTFDYQDLSITNLEMETAGIYALAAALGHNALSLNAILANRITGEFSTKGGETVNHLIEWGLNWVAEI